MTRIVVFLLVLAALPIQADEVSLDEVLLRDEDSMLESSRQWLAESINRVSSGLDAFLVNRFFGEQITEEKANGSTGRLAIFTRRESSDVYEYRFEGRLKLDLPHTDDRIDFLIQSEDDSDYPLNKDPVQSVEKANYFTTLRFLLDQSKLFDTDFDVGIHWAVPPDPYVRLRTINNTKFEKHEFRVVQSFFYYALDGLGERTEFQFNRPLDEKRLFRVQAGAQYWQDDGYFSVGYGFGLYHSMPHNAMLALLAGSSGDTNEGAVFDSYYAGIKYRRDIYKNWIFAEITPQFEWNEDRNYIIMPVIMFRIEALIAPN